MHDHTSPDTDLDAYTDQFESLTIDPHGFGHRQHVQVAWTLVRRHGSLEAARRFEEALIAITGRLGITDKYHATITYALVFLVAERVAQQDAQTWDAFESDNPDVLEWPSPALQAIYSDEQLWSQEARARFVLPRPVGS